MAAFQVSVVPNASISLLARFSMNVSYFYDYSSTFTVATGETMTLD